MTTRAIFRIASTIVAAALLFAILPVRSNAQNLSSFSLSNLVNLLLNTTPPALPQYYQPSAPQQNMIWQPGYWSYGQGGYFWVPGTWVYPPRTGLYWTPGYWGSDGGGYRWNPGYWSQSVGYYGGVNYGNGYYGNGYSGGRWHGNDFYYNTAVSNVQTRYVRYVYVDRTALVNQYRGNRISYNGGRGGFSAHPTHADVAAARERHYPMTSAQRQHILVASQNRNYLASVNHGRPAVVSVPRPLAAHNHPVGFSPVRSSDRIQHAAPVRRPQQQHEAPVRRPQQQRAPSHQHHTKPHAKATSQPALR